MCPAGTGGNRGRALSFQRPFCFVLGCYQYLSVQLALETVVIGEVASMHPQNFQVSSSVTTCPQSLCHSYITLENISGGKRYSSFENRSEEAVI